MSTMPTGEQDLRVLVVEDNRADVKLVRDALAVARGRRFAITDVARLSDALERLKVDPFDVVLLDLGLPDSKGLATFSLLHAPYRLLPILVLSGLDDERVAVDAVRLGAQDYLVKGKYEDGLLARAIHYAMERQRLLYQVEQALGYVRNLLHEAQEARGLAAKSGSFLAMCAWCKRVRDEGRWQTIEQYLAAHTQANLTHSICPHCRKELPAGPGNDFEG